MRTATEDDIEWKNNKTQPAKSPSLLSAAYVSTKWLSPTPRLVCWLDDCWHYIYIIMERMKVLFYCNTQESLFSLFNHHQESFSSSPPSINFLPFKLFTFFHRNIINAFLSSLVCHKYSYQQLMLFAICTNIYIKRREEKKFGIMFFLLSQWKS